VDVFPHILAARKLGLTKLTLRISRGHGDINDLLTFYSREDGTALSPALVFQGPQQQGTEWENTTTTTTISENLNADTLDPGVSNAPVVRVREFVLLFILLFTQY
jgi:hypothetical protein